MNKKGYILSVFLVMLLISCEEVLLGEDSPNTPINNFEILWHDFDEHYSLFEVRNLNWDSIYNQYRPLVSNETTQDEMWDIFKSMISYLDDSHSMILKPSADFDMKTDFFESGSEYVEQAKREFSIEVIENNYLDNHSSFRIAGSELYHTYGKLSNRNVGYIHLPAMEADSYSFIDEILEDFKLCDAIILDIRNNSGGSDVLAAEIAGRFTTQESLIYTVEEKNGAGHGEFAEKINYYSLKKGREYFDKSLIVLTDRVTVSAAEVLLIHLNSFDQVIQIGDTTAGDFSDTSMRRFLPNGWQYQYSIFKFLLPDGTSLDGKGHVPQIVAKNTVTDIEGGTDRVLERAVDYLSKEFEIN